MPMSCKDFQIESKAETSGQEETYTEFPGQDT